MTPPSPLLRIEGLTKHYGGVVAMQDVRLAVEPGALHALVGENGAGKSTLVKCLSGAVRPDKGVMTLFGERFAPRSPAEAVQLGVGVVFQELSLIPDLTVAENIWFRQEAVSRTRAIKQRQLDAAASDLFEQCGLVGIPVRKRARDLSVAERQLVEIVKVIARKPKLFVLDEATSALSPREVEWTLGQARRLAAAGTSVLFISHRLAEVRALASRITVFRGGRSVDTVESAEVTDDELIYKMLGRRVDRLYPAKSRTILQTEAFAVRGISVGTKVKDATFSVREGEILGVGGLQGHGQLQLFLALFGVLRARGEILVRGARVRIRNPRDALKAGVALALVPEDRQTEGLLLPLSIRENIVLPSLGSLSRAGFITKSVERAAIRSVVERLRIKAASTEQEARSLSGGNQQKVVIAKFLATEARIFCLYDLTRGVDIGTKAEIFELMRELADAGLSVLFYSTELAELVNVADRVAVMSDGAIRGFLEGDALTEEAILRLAMSQVEASHAEVSS
jgi:ribose transport system ATP-binding protein